MKRLRHKTADRANQRPTNSLAIKGSTVNIFYKFINLIIIILFQHIHVDDAKCYFPNKMEIFGNEYL